MANCKNCGVKFEWGAMDGKWVPLIPTGEEGEHERTHVDSNGVLRTLHNVICTGYTSVIQITKLARPIPASQAQTPKAKGRKKKAHLDMVN